VQYSFAHASPTIVTPQIDFESMIGTPPHTRTMTCHPTYTLLMGVSDARIAADLLQQASAELEGIYPDGVRWMRFKHATRSAAYKSPLEAEMLLLFRRRGELTQFVNVLMRPIYRQQREYATALTDAAAAQMRERGCTEKKVKGRVSLHFLLFFI
jgi:hypothetical protein